MQLKLARKDEKQMTTESTEVPLVSVLMPVKNSSETLGEAIDSVLNQSMKEFELVIIDDHSTDGTVSILKKYQEIDSRVRVLPNRGKGLTDALNFAIECARSSLIARMDADDISEPERLKRQFETFNDNEKLVLLGTYTLKFGDDSPEPCPVIMPTDNESIKSSILLLPTFAHPSIMMRLGPLKKIGGYRKFFEGAEDHDLYLRLREHGEFAILPEFLLNYRAHATQFSRLKSAQGYAASVASVYCNHYAAGELSDPSASGRSCQQLAFELLEHMATGKEPMTNRMIKLCVRAFQGLAAQPEFEVKLPVVRKKIMSNLIGTKQFKATWKIWRSTKKSNWAIH